MLFEKGRKDCKSLLQPGVILQWLASFLSLWALNFTHKKGTREVKILPGCSHTLKFTMDCDILPWQDFTLF
jgi:hypothetical protein